MRRTKKEVFFSSSIFYDILIQVKKNSDIEKTIKIWRLAVGWQRTERSLLCPHIQISCVHRGCRQSLEKGMQWKMPTNPSLILIWRSFVYFSIANVDSGIVRGQCCQVLLHTVVMSTEERGKWILRSFDRKTGICACTWSGNYNFPHVIFSRNKIVW